MNSSKIFHSKTNSTYDSWQSELADGISDVNELLTLLNLPSQTNPYAPKKFSLRVPRAFVAKMQAGDANDPLLLQVLPNALEQQIHAGYSTDPLAENEHNPIKGLLHKYRSRVLLTVTGACAVHCRYCFRQHFDYGANLPTSAQIDDVMSYIAQHHDVDEVLLSGGDPLNLNNRKLGVWLDAINQLDNIKTIRLHTRLPVVLPNRIDDELLTLLTKSNKRLVMVLHINHPNEIDDKLMDKCARLKAIGVTLLNQTVLLKGINDDAQVLGVLSHRLFDAGVLPYYLHVLDKVQGAAHFDLDISVAVALYWQLLERLPGYLVPKLVQELPNRPYKTPIDIYRHRTC